MPEPDAFEITVDGEQVQCTEGQSLAACLLASGRSAWRRTRHGGADRGLFCGIGVCFDCLLTVNGETSVRACVSAARAGDVVITDDGGPGA